MEIRNLELHKNSIPFILTILAIFLLRKSSNVTSVLDRGDGQNNSPDYTVRGKYWKKNPPDSHKKAKGHKI